MRKRNVFEIKVDKRTKYDEIKFSPISKNKAKKKSWKLEKTDDKSFIKVWN